MKRLLWVLPILAIAAIATAQSTYHFAAPVMPVYASGGQPSGAASVGQIAIIGTNNAPWVDSNSGQWVSVQEFPNYRLEDYGAVPGCSTTPCKTANQAAWNAIQAAIGYGYVAAKGRILVDGVFYFLSEIHPGSQQIIQGVAGGSASSGGSTLVFPYTSRGVVFDYFSAADPNGNAQGDQLNDIWVTHQQGLPSWAANHSYTGGSAVGPSFWGGYVFQNQGSTGTSASGPPAWPNNIVTPSAAPSPSPVTDGSVTWTPLYVPLVEINAQVYLRNVTVTYGYGDGIVIYGDTTHFIADGVNLTNVWSANNRSAGLFVSGSDAQIGVFTNVTSIINGTFGLLGTTALANKVIGGQLSYNGPNYLNDGAQVVEPNQTFGGAGCCIEPPLDPSYTALHGNQFGYAFSYSSGTTGPSNPPAASWPTGPGGTLVDGTVTFTNVGPYYGGDISTNDSLDGVYQESSGVPAYIGGSSIQSTLGSGWSQDSPGMVDSGLYKSPFIVNSQYGGPGSNADPNFEVGMTIGDAQNALWPTKWTLINKKTTAPIDSVIMGYGAGNFIFKDSSATNLIGFPLAGVAQANTVGYPSFPNGFFIGSPRNAFGSAPNLLIKTTAYSPSPSTADVADDVQYRAGDANLGSGEPTEFTAVSSATGGANGIWRESNWTAPAEGNRIDVLQTLPETDLQLIMDDILYVDANVPSRVNSYYVNGANGGTFGPAADIIGGGILYPQFIFYDSSMRARQGLWIYHGTSEYYFIAANSAHMMPASGKLTLEVQFWNANSGQSGNVTVMGGYTANSESGWELSVTSAGALLFRAANTAAGYFVTMTSATGLISNESMHQATVEWDSVDNYYMLLLDGAVVASTASTTGTLGTTATNIGVCGLMTGASTVSQNGYYLVIQIERTLRNLSLFNEIPARNAQVQAINAISAVASAVGPSNVLTTLKGYETEVFLTGPSMTVTLPPAGFEPSGYQVRFVDANGNAGTTAQTISPAGSDKINGANSSVTIGTNFGSKVVSDFSGQWYAQ